VTAQIHARGVDGVGVDGAAKGDDASASTASAGRLSASAASAGSPFKPSSSTRPQRRRRRRESSCCRRACRDCQRAGRASPAAVRLPSGLKASEFVRHQVREFGVGLFEFEQHRRGEIAQQRGDRRGGMPSKTKVCVGSVSDSTRVVSMASGSPAS